MVYEIADTEYIRWGVNANSPEEAHAKFKGIAARLIGSCKTQEMSSNQKVRKEIVKIMKGSFQVRINQYVEKGWSDVPRWAK